MTKKVVKNLIEEMLSEHFTSEELAARYNMHPKSVANWRAQGIGPKYIKVKNRVLYKPEDVEIWEAIHLIRKVSTH